MFCLSFLTFLLMPRAIQGFALDLSPLSPIPGFGISPSLASLLATSASAVRN